MASSRPRWVVPVAAAAAALLGFELLAALATLPPALEAFAHNWLFSFLPLAGAAMCVARSLREPAERLPWAALAVTMVGWSAADAYYVWGILRDTAPPFPSWTDAGWIPFYPACLVAVVALLRRESQRPTAAVALDAVVAALASGALLIALVGPSLAGSITGSTVADAVTLAYPAFDVLLIALVMAAFVVTGWHPGLRWTLLAVALALRVTEDTGWLEMVTHGGYEHGTVMDVMCPASMLLIGVAAWTPARQPRAVATNGLHVLVVPAVATLISLGLLVADQPLRLPLSATLLAVCAILAVVARMAVTYGELRGLAGSREEALTDDLTGLPNRRRLMRDLE
ncbi:MAG: diguanylate cyclase, partial [Solirubrobacteraceae bacterium]|nr:diguanylate cyclase [Solirubrobacteraceae bacterium]